MRLYQTIFYLLGLAAASVIASQRSHQNGPPKQAPQQSGPTQSITFQHKRRRTYNPPHPRQTSDVVVTFDVRETTAWGESMQLVGSISQLGTWNTGNAVSLNASRYTNDNPLWFATVDLPAGSSFTYKYIKVGTDGNITWEAGPDRSYAMPSSGSSATISDKWQATIPSTITTKTAPSSTTSTTPAASCTHGSASRGCWSDGFSIDTNFDDDWPVTGNTVSYTLTVTNTTIAPDGFRRQGYQINGQFPGPAIRADWGDTIQVTVQNRLQNNGTSIHWHGMRMYHNNAQDGVPGVTECPIAPGQQKTYTFTATQYGTIWYHSHFSNQYADGVWGPIMINGPASANYDQDLGPYHITDWYYPTVASISSKAQHQNALAPTADTALINGTMVSTSGGSYARTVLSAGKKHRVRVINTATDNHFQFSLDGHILTVIAADFVPIVPYNAAWIFIGIGQRYDVLIDANQTPGSYWFRAEVQDTAGCGSNFKNGNILSIFSYKGHEGETPTTTAKSYTQRCTDETNIVSYWNSFVPQGDIPSSLTQLDTAINQSAAADGSLTVYWQVNGTPARVNWSTPTVGHIRDNVNYDSWGARTNVMELEEGVWTYWIITEGSGSPFTVNIPHPIHLHGHDFYVLGWDTSAWSDSNRAELNYKNPVRRDVAMLPVNGWMALAFYSNNPGAWLMHCHIAWHADEGFAVQFVESQSKMLAVDPLPSDYDSQCSAWDAFYPSGAPYLQEDSGI